MGKPSTAKEAQTQDIDAVTAANAAAIAGEPVVADEPELSFDERTAKTQPWRDEDGKQVNQ
jgi:hypothetical protein